MHTYLICIGSNYGREENIFLARQYLTKHYPSIVFGNELETEPLCLSHPAMFTNVVARFTTSHLLEEVQTNLKQLEKSAGRTREGSDKGVIPLDIDILKFDDTILKPDDITRQYVVDGLKTLPDRSVQPAIRTVDKINILRPVRMVMDNGVPLHVINAGHQDVVRLDIIFKGGSWHQTHKLQALFTNRMLREGTRRFTAADIAAKLDYYGAWLELSSSVEYAYITLYSLNKYFRQTLEILESIIKEPVFPERGLATVIETNLQQFRINSTKVDFLAHRSLMSALFGSGHPCGRMAEEQDYLNINPEMLGEFYNQFYSSNNCSVYISGKVTDDIITLIKERFGSTVWGNTDQFDCSPGYQPVTTTQKRIFTQRQDALQSAVKLGERTITRQHADFHKLRVLITLFGGYFGSRLMANIREDKGYTYGISAGLYTYPDTGIMVISTETGNEFVEPLIAEVYKEIDKLQNEQVDAAELSVVRNYMIGETSRSYESPFSLSDAWIFIHTSGLADDFFDQSLQAIKEVTPSELQNLACTYMNKDNLKEIIAGKNIS